MIYLLKTPVYKALYMEEIQTLNYVFMSHLEIVHIYSTKLLFYAE